MADRIDPAAFEELAQEVRSAVAAKARASQCWKNAQEALAQAAKAEEDAWNRLQSYVADCAGLLDPAVQGRMGIRRPGQ